MILGVALAVADRSRPTSPSRRGVRGWNAVQEVKEVRKKWKLRRKSRRGVTGRRRQRKGDNLNLSFLTVIPGLPGALT